MRYVAEFERLWKVCTRKPLYGRMINLRRVAECRTIQVHNIGDVYEDILSLYFESKRNGYGEVVHVEMCREDNYALLKMVDKAREFQ